MISLIILITISLLSSLAVTWLLIGFLQRRQILDRPNHRSSHHQPTPRGGGIAVLAAIVLAWITAVGLGLLPETLLIVLALAVGLGVICFIDDLRGLGARLRFISQFAAVVMGLAVLPNGGLFANELPAVLDLAITAVVWLWFINLFNFMDGIDGITGVETMVISGGLCGLIWLTGGSDWIFATSLTIAGAAAGFLIWNWHPARIFLGDVGSIPLGFLLGWLCIAVAGQSPGVGSVPWTAVLILPLYYFFDATGTLLSRLWRRQNIFEAHREHAYQRAVIHGRRHDQVSAAVAICGLGLWLAALVITPVTAIGGLLAAIIMVAGLLAWMRRPKT